ncbi:helix-turn-helix domain-containing protein [Bacteroides sp. 51]|uniref:helix-turn-helix domain-containing protein n=1 Tax=Bacteroides sp. 51 TaxID=2302938 RepID=UPI0013D39BFC|nr:helix-turn-helix transcriptional regulator [Bacteroides sp. 51]NDV81288.1 XRE family transcriptional regulator [Bacteroides sp. 51]
MITGERLKGYLKAHGISAREFAQMIEMSEAMVYKYYKMDGVDTKTVTRWAEVLHVPIMTFLDDEMYERATHKATPEELAEAEEYYNRNKDYIRFQNRRFFGDLAGASKEVLEEEFKKIKRNLTKSDEDEILKHGIGPMLNDAGFTSRQEIHGKSNVNIGRDNNGKISISECESKLEDALLRIKHLEERLKDKEEMIEILRMQLKK